MTEQSLESGQNAGTPGQTNPGASAEGASPSLDVKALAEALKPYIADVVTRATQSQKDRRIGKMEGKVSDFEAQLARMNELVGEGWSQKQALRLMQSGIVEATNTDEEPAASQKPAQVSAQSVTSVEATKVIDVLGLDANDPDVLRATLGAKDPIPGLIELASARKAKAAQPPNPATIMGSGGGAASSETLDTLTEELTRLMRNPSANEARIREVGAKQKALLLKR